MIYASFLNSILVFIPILKHKKKKNAERKQIKFVVNAD